MTFRCRRRPPSHRADTTALTTAIAKLKALVPPEKVKELHMSAPTDLVSISQADLTNFATEINTAVGVLAPYIQQLLAGQAVTLAPADETAVQAAVTALQGSEPPAPVTPTP